MRQKRMTKLKGPEDKGMEIESTWIMSVPQVAHELDD